MTSKAERDRPTGSFNSFGNIKKIKELKCCSQPFLKPTFGRGKLSERLMKIVCKILHLKSVDPTGPEPVDFTLDESKLILREIAQELDRILQMRDLSLLTKVSKDGSSLEERRAFLLQLAQDIPPRAHAQEMKVFICSHIVPDLSSDLSTFLYRCEMLHGQSAVSRPCNDVLEENSGEACKPQPEVDKRLEKAIGDLSTWTWTLREMEEDSVCLDMDVVEVVKEMCQQWKSGNLPNILPVLDFVIWSILQQEGQKLSIAQHWNRNQELFKSRADPLHVPDSVWKWITTTTAKVRLDKSTANPCLKISQDGRAVKMDQIVESVCDPWEDFTRTKHKYDSWWCVLGTEGFVSGKHYWEVDVRGKTEWRIGVVRESAPRNGFKVLNEMTGYWTLNLQLGRFMAMTVPVTKLDRCAPSVLGLFLDMEEGQVSFYDVGHRFHIYSFNVSFGRDETIFPVFGTVETEREMRILN